MNLGPVFTSLRFKCELENTPLNQVSNLNVYILETGRSEIQVKMFSLSNGGRGCASYIGTRLTVNPQCSSCFIFGSRRTGM